MKARFHRSTLLLLLTFLASPLAAEVRTWRDQESDIAIDAELVDVEGDKITLKINGKNFTYPATRFHREDQEYVKDWTEERDMDRKDAASDEPASPEIQRAIQVAVKPVTESGETERTGEKNLKGKKRADTTFFEITLANARSGPEMKNITVDYTIYTRTETSDSADRKSGRTLFVPEEDSETLESLLPGTTGSVKTKTITATESTTPYEKEKRSYDKELSEKVVGVVLRIRVDGALAKTLEHPDGLLRTIEKEKN